MATDVPSVTPVRRARLSARLSRLSVTPLCHARLLRPSVTYAPLLRPSGTPDLLHQDGLTLEVRPGGLQVGSQVCVWGRTQVVVWGPDPKLMILVS